MAEPFKDFPRKARIALVIGVLSYLVGAVWAVHDSRPLAVSGLVAIFTCAGLVKRVPNPSGGANVPLLGLWIVAALLWRPSEVWFGVGVGSFIGLLIFWRTEVWRAALNMVLWGPPAAAAALLAQMILAKNPLGLLPPFIAGGLAIVTFRILNMGLFAGYRSLRFGNAFFADWGLNVIANWPSQLLSAPLAIVAAIVAARTGTVAWRLVLTALPAVTLPFARQELAYYFRSQQMLDEIVEAVVRALEGVEPHARVHGDRVSTIAVATGRRLRMSGRELLGLRLAARLHDVGLLAVEGVPSREDQLAAISGRILERFPDPMIAEIVRARQERWDGKGGPDHKSGAVIPLGARILAAADVYDCALEGLQPFTAPHSRQEAASHLISLAGTVLDPKVVMALIHVAMEKAPEFEAAAG
jgi:HD domain